MSAVGPSDSTAIAQAAAHSLPSAGRMRRSCGIARSEASCSIGWWVGPSSPRPIESWVKKKTACASDIAPRRMAGRA